MKKYILSEMDYMRADIRPIIVYDSYLLFQEGLIKHFSKMVRECEEDQSKIKNGMTISFSFKVNVAESDED